MTTNSLAAAVRINFRCFLRCCLDGHKLPKRCDASGVVKFIDLRNPAIAETDDLTVFAAQYVAGGFMLHEARNRCSRLFIPESKTFDYRHTLCDIKNGKQKVQHCFLAYRNKWLCASRPDIAGVADIIAIAGHQGLHITVAPRQMRCIH